MTAASAISGLALPGRETLARIALAGLAGGVVDFVYPSGMAVLRGRPWESPWLTVASGWIGRAAREGGVGPITLGLATHFGIAICMAGAYWLVAQRFSLLYRRWWACAPAYGLILYGVMYRIVLPLRFGEAAGAWRGPLSWLDVAAHIGVALAIAYVLSRPGKAR